MKRCTTCGMQWDTADAHCPHDGTPLVSAEVGVTGARSPSTTWSAQVPALAASRSTANDELLPGTCVGEYVIERKIGIGGMGVVYGARHPVIGKRAAIKILNAKLSVDEEAASRFVLEAQAVNKIGHANIVDIFSFGTLDDGRSYFAMEWLQGETLGQRLARGRLASREAIVILSALCRALEAAHAAGVIHRDLKPDNVFLATDDESWRVKLLDFGIAKLSTPTTPITRTATGVAMGTPLYMAPEQARGELVDGRTDVYALGLLAYATVCGESLFHDEGSAIEILAAHINKPPPSPRRLVPDISRAFEQLILAMIAKQPDERPPLVEVRRQLAAIAAVLANPAPALSPPPGPATERVSDERLQQLRPPQMPTEVPAQAAQIPRQAPQRPPAAELTMAPQRPPAAEPTTQPPQMPTAAPQTLAPAQEMPNAGESIEADDIVVPRRARWPLAIIAAALLAAGATLVIAVSRQTAPSPAQSASRLPVTPAPAAPPAAAAAVPAPAPITAELAVEPRLAHLTVDDHPVTLVGDRVTLQLPPGDHVAIATVGARSTRKPFVVTANHVVKVSLHVPDTDTHVAPSNRPPTREDVDAIHDPFHR